MPESVADEAGNEKRLLVLRVSNKGRGPITEIIVKVLEFNETHIFFKQNFVYYK